MLKYLSYLNLFLGIIFIAILKNGENYLDLALIVPSIFFNWVTLFHFIRNNLKFEKWHLVLGFLSVFFSLASALLTFQIFLQTSVSNNIIYFGIARLIFDLLIILQFVLAFRANRFAQLNK